MSERILILSVAAPEYTVKHKPDYMAVGKKLDEIVEKNFRGKTIAIRGISLEEHPGMTLDSLISIILRFGTDRYDPQRKSVCHEEFEPYMIDMHATPCVVSESGLESECCEELPSVMAESVKDFYEGAPLDRGYPVRLDALLIYDLTQLERAQKVDETKQSVASRLEPFLFRFKDPAKKQKALLGIVKILK